MALSPELGVTAQHDSDDEQLSQELSDAEVRKIADVLAGKRKASRVVIDHGLLKEKLNDWTGTGKMEIAFC